MAINESTVNVKTLERCFNQRIDREMSNIVDTVEDKIQNAILTAIGNIIYTYYKCETFLCVCVYYQTPLPFLARFGLNFEQSCE